MKKIYLILAILIAFSSCKIRESRSDGAILKVLEDQRQAWNRGDIETYMEGYLRSDSLVFVGKGGPKYGWQTTLDNYKKGYPDKAAMGFLTFKILKVTPIGSDHAFVVGGWLLKREKDEPQGFFTLVFKKVNGTWRIISDHSS